MPKVVLYTCITGGRDLAKPMREQTAPTTRCVMFCDDPAVARVGCHGWEVRSNLFEGATPIRTARWHKHNPHQLFPDADVTIWIDGTHTPIKPVEDLLQYVENTPIAAFRHQVRSKVSQEADAVLALKLDRIHTVREQIVAQTKEGFPDDKGLFSTGCLVRRSSQAMAKFQEDWWASVSYGSHRDQLSFTYQLWRHGIACTPIPGHSRDAWVLPGVPHRPSEYFEVTLHRHNPIKD